MTDSIGKELIKTNKYDIQTSIPLLEEIFREWQSVIGSEYQGYRNHVYRMSQFVIALLEKESERKATDDEKSKIFIAAAFHDIGIWIENTVDYIEPSIPPAQQYLESVGKSEWKKEITLMISEHHKVTKFKQAEYPLVELFRKGDLVDFSLGIIRYGLKKDFVTTMKVLIPNENFHKNLGKRAWRWFLKHPLNPAPMMKW